MVDTIKEFADKCMIVRIPVSINYEKIYDATRHCWWANIDNVIMEVFYEKNCY